MTITYLSSAELAQKVVKVKESAPPPPLQNKKKKGFDMSCKVSVLETVCMKCQIIFSG